MTREEFEKIVENFDPEKDNIKDKVDELFEKGANLVPVFHFINEHLHCGLNEALELAESCPGYHKRYDIEDIQ